MRYAVLEGTNMEVSVVCCGTMAMAPHPTYRDRPDDDQSIAAIGAALDAGVTFFDTAEAYGDGCAEQVLGRALAGRRDQAVIATKVSCGHLAEGDLISACEGSLQRLRTDYIDLYQVHWPNHGIPFAETASVLDRLKEQGKVRAWGVSNFGRLDLSEAVEAGPPVTNQVPYSLLWRVIEHEVLPLCREHEVGVICYSPLAQGILTGRYSGPEDIPAARQRPRYCDEGRAELAFDVVDQLHAVSEEIGEPMATVALAWLLARAGVTSVIAGASTPEQAAQNARAGNLQLPAGLVERLTGASEPLKQALDRNPDMWQAGGRSRYR